MKFEVVGTHNPQDFYNGTEPDELVKIFVADEEDLIETIQELLNNGYQVIVGGVS